jgi:hypothetical protein
MKEILGINLVSYIYKSFLNKPLVFEDLEEFLDKNSYQNLK